MSKAVYFVSVVHKGRESDYQALSKRGALPGGYPNEIGFVEPIRASNRREAFILVRRKYPDHLVLDDAIKASS
ncbi:hypothetical protein [Dyella sp. C11]|uniref:hypothetical protein n=1 Tax=Dyella sp. C11 TaxID=2126991 RepID=UPI000D65E20F|nr:hypothetical protein [Dyella sp. C11]